MKKLSVLLVIELCLLITWFERTMGQSVGIGNAVFTPDPSSMLEVRATDKGILITRVALVATTNSSPITSPATSLLVYNTATQNDVTPGYYYWDGTKWVRLLENDKAWLLNGNAASATNFLGTTNAIDLRFVTNNTERMRITSGGSVGIGTTSPTYLLDVRGGMRVGDGVSTEQGIRLINNNGDWQVGVNNAGNGTSGNQLYVYSVSDGVYRLTIQRGSGNIGINTYNPTARLHVDGTVRFVNLAAPSGETTALVIDGSGNVKARTLNTVAFNGETDPNAW
ncbi:MAG: hypothetical protein N2Z72_02670, partial [Bacteroidales bacterium]|nr:hypothetical protein [Bacteroidales bacterium]